MQHEARVLSGRSTGYRNPFFRIALPKSCQSISRFRRGHFPAGEERYAGGMRFLLPLLCSLLLVACGAERAAVVRVVDGDTIHVQLSNGAEETIRFIGIDTPETVDPRRPVGCYGPEASTELHRILDGKEVILQTKPDEDHDQYGRLLRYVELGGEDVGALLLSGGFAKTYDRYPHPRLQTYDQLAWQARAEGRGLWGACSSRSSAGGAIP